MRVPHATTRETAVPRVVALIQKIAKHLTSTRSALEAWHKVKSLKHHVRKCRIYLLLDPNDLDDLRA